MLTSRALCQLTRLRTPTTTTTGLFGSIVHRKYQHRDVVSLPNMTTDYSIEDAKDDTGVDDNDIVGDDDEVWHYLDNIPEASLGYGWFDNEMALLCQSVDLSTRKFTNSPRPYDKRPADVPAQHPIRAVAKVLDLAPPDSTIRIYCYALSDPFELDLFTHHGGDKTVKIIMQPCDRSVGRIKDF